MKRCPTCQQTYPDNVEVCPNDGMQLYTDPGQWQQPPPGGYYPPPPGQYQPQGQYPPPPGQYPPPYGATGQVGRSGLSKAALFTGIGAAGVFVIGFILAMIGVSNLDIDMLQIASVIILLSLIAGLAAIVLGIVVLAMAGKNPAMSKVHGILALVLGVIPIIFWIIGVANSSSVRYRY